MIFKETTDSYLSRMTSRPNMIDVPIACMTLMYAVGLVRRYFDKRLIQHESFDQQQADDTYFRAKYWGDFVEGQDMDEHPVFRHSAHMELCPTEVHHLLAIYPGIDVSEVLGCETMEIAQAAGQGIISLARLIEPSTHKFLCKQVEAHGPALAQAIQDEVARCKEIGDTIWADPDPELDTDETYARNVRAGNVLIGLMSDYDTPAETRLALHRLRGHGQGIAFGSHMVVLGPFREAILSAWRKG